MKLIACSMRFVAMTGLQLSQIRFRLLKRALSESFHEQLQVWVDRDQSGVVLHRHGDHNGVFHAFPARQDLVKMDDAVAMAREREGDWHGRPLIEKDGGPPIAHAAAL
jgi:hypothetical protein